MMIMKNISLYVLVLSTVLFSCKKEQDRVFDKSPDERLNETLAAYQSQLSGAQYGWKAVVFPAGGGAFAFYFKFNDSNRVQMVSDFDSTLARTLKESSYRLKALQQPSLLFDTYSYLHILADPNPNINGGKTGAGLTSDFEFYFDKVVPDTINLVGRFNGSKAILTKATQQEATAYTTGQFNINSFRNDLNRILEYFKRLVIGNQQYDINISPAAKTVNFSWLDGSGNIQTFSTSFYYTLTGIQFSTPFVNGNTTISSLENSSWNATTNVLTVNISSSATATITGGIKPLKVDLTAPQRWYQFAATDPTFFSASFNGFHKDGVDDYFQLRSIAPYYVTLYYPQYQPVPPNNELTDYMAMLYVVNNSLSFTNSFGPLFTPPSIDPTTGILTFNLSDYVRTAPTNLGANRATATQILTAVRNQMAEPTGYYFVQVGTNTYDMVNVLDAKTWITWEPF
jgi:hypothetical protein